MYLWIKALHIIAVISWMAGLLYLPRLFVYHSDALTGSPQSETFKIMERRLLNAIMTPAMIVTWASGFYLALQSGFYAENWFKLKFSFVLLLTLFHFILQRCQKIFAIDKNRNGAKYYRIINEIPTLIMIAVVVLVVVKP
jgi:putative membrane protein